MKSMSKNAFLNLSQSIKFGDIVPIYVKEVIADEFKRFDLKFVSK